MPLINDILQKYWGHPAFRPMQEDIINSVLKGNDTLALLPTGGGKSICFQVPALAMDGLCLVVSPLIALMKDQVQNLLKRDISAAAIYSGLTNREVGLILNNAVHGNLKFLYVSPERLESRVFLEHLKQMKISLLAIDEAHCISQWGYDFRPPYLQIARIRKLLKNVPVMALTATATPEVVDDIQEKLEFKEKCVFQQSFKRENLTYYVINEEDKHSRLIRIIKTIQGAGVVYVRNRKKTKEIAEFLNKKGIVATYYHAGLDQQLRNQRQADWIAGKTPVIVATNAFGMGIDKPNVRFVVHLDLPDSLEAYFQEAGRGGRDGKRAHAIVLYDNIDKANLEKNFQTTYPELVFIKNVYQAIGSYYRIPIGAAKDAAFDFDLKDFAETFRFNAIILYNVLKILEKEGLIYLSEEVNTPSKVLILASKNHLYDLQLQNEKIDRVLKALFRSYGGIFSAYTAISEKEIAKRADMSEKTVVEVLQVLKNKDYIDYIPIKSIPQIFITSEYLDVKNIRISKENYHLLKEKALQRLKAVFNYATSSHTCRSRLLLAYFGEIESSACGLCDVCIENKKKELSAAQYEVMKEKLFILLAQKALPVADIFLCMKEYSNDKITEMLRYLIDVEEIHQDGQGRFCI